MASLLEMTGALLLATSVMGVIVKLAPLSNLHLSPRHPLHRRERPSARDKCISNIVAGQPHRAGVGPGRCGALGATHRAQPRGGARCDGQEPAQRQRGQPAPKSPAAPRAPPRSPRRQPDGERLAPGPGRGGARLVGGHAGLAGPRVDPGVASHRPAHRFHLVRRAASRSLPTGSHGDANAVARVVRRHAVGLLGALTGCGDAPHLTQKHPYTLTTFDSHLPAAPLLRDRSTVCQQ